MKFAVSVQWELAQFGDDRYILLVTHQRHRCMWRNSKLSVGFHSTKQSISIKDEGEQGRTHLQVAPHFFVARMWKFTRKKKKKTDWTASSLLHSDCIGLLINSLKRSWACLNWVCDLRSCSLPDQDGKQTNALMCTYVYQVWSSNFLCLVQLSPLRGCIKQGHCQKLKPQHIFISH